MFQEDYIENQVQGASQAELVELLLSRACRDLDVAHLTLTQQTDESAWAEATKLGVHAQRITAELQRTLDFTNGGDLARNLGRLYDYVQFRISEAMTRREPQGFEDSRQLLNDVLEGWRGIPRESASSYQPRMIGRDLALAG